MNDEYNTHDYELIVLVILIQTLATPKYTGHINTWNKHKKVCQATPNSIVFKDMYSLKDLYSHKTQSCLKNRSITTKHDPERSIYGEIRFS